MLISKKISELLSEKNFTEAKELLEELAIDNPKDVDVLYNLGMVFTELDNPEAAVRTLKQCISIDPKHANALVALGFAFYKLNNLDDAKMYLVDALKIEPDNPYALKNLGGVFAKFEDYNKTLYYLIKAENVLPNDAQILYGLGLAYAKIGNISKADEYFKKVILLPDAIYDIKELARIERTKIAVDSAKNNGFRADAMFYCLSALKLFSKMSISEIQSISFEIAIKGRSGLDINNPDRRYTLKSLPGSFTGMQLLSYMYAGFKCFAPEQDIGADFSDEYRVAQNLFNADDVI